MTEKPTAGSFFDTYSNETLGIILKILSVLCFAIMSGLVKYLHNSIPLAQLVFCRSVFAAIPLLIFLLCSKDFFSLLKTNQPYGHIKRCVIGTVAMFCAFQVLEMLPLAEATTLNYLSPIFLVVLAMLFLKEQVTTRRWLGVGFGVLGLLVMTLPNFSLLHTDFEAGKQSLAGIGLGVLSAFGIAMAMLQVRQLTQMGEHSGTIIFYFMVTTSVVSGVIMFSYNFYNPDTLAWQWLCLIAIGIVGGLAQILMTSAFQYAEASAIAPYDYLAMIFAVIIGFVVFDEVPDIMFWFAMPLIIVGAMIAKPIGKLGIKVPTPSSK